LHKLTPASKLRVRVQRVRDALPAKQEDVFFPLQEADMMANETPEGIAKHIGIEPGGIHYDFPDGSTEDNSVMAAQPPCPGVAEAEDDDKGRAFRN
jgi:hypothetical protein